MSSLVYLALGSNLGDRQRNLEEALDRLTAHVVLHRVSSVYETEPWGYVDQPRFLNAACSGATGLAPDDLLREVKAIEVKMGRVFSFPNAPRPMDIDILLYGEQVIETPDLVIPHPRMAERPFVLVPLAEIAPDVVHPVLRVTAQELLQRCGGREGVQWYSSLALPKEQPGATSAGQGEGGWGWRPR